ncbi:10434_t:CDS:2 [Paraglomus occultum]|uniref:Derlin n=1 Tax=Paraglomus occultum TaxID=144539 RepID=A0A9N9F7W0_9GLOM|nr:10434_t:CDS:2 [Paraglomus occultum]
MAMPIEEWYYEVPLITRTYMTAAVATSLLVYLGIISPYQLYFNYDLIVHRHQYWRLVTNFLYFGTFSLEFLFHMFFLVRHSRMLEEGSFRGKTADFFWLLIFAATATLVSLTDHIMSQSAIVFISSNVKFADNLQLLSPIASLLPGPPMTFLGSPLAFTLVYIWSRRNPWIRLNFLGLFVFSAPFLPWVLLGFSLLLNSGFPTGDLMGIAVGHIYYFFEDVWPNERQSGGVRILKTPAFITRLFETSDDVNIRQPENIGFPADDVDTGADNEQPESAANTTDVAPDVTAPAT